MESKYTIHLWGKEWKNSKGQLHRENDLPAIEYNDGAKVWYINGKVHRELGPAIIKYERVCWYLNDNECSPENMPPKLFLVYCLYEYKRIQSITNNQATSNVVKS